MNVQMGSDGYLEVRGIRIIDEHGRTRVQIDARELWAGIQVWGDNGRDRAGDDDGTAILAVSSEHGGMADSDGLPLEHGELYLAAGNVSVDLDPTDTKPKKRKGSSRFSFLTSRPKRRI